MDTQVSCPNCGQPFVAPVELQAHCPNCRETLVLVAPNKWALANPIPTYLELAEPNADAPERLIRLSDRRQQVAAEFARQRLTEQGHAVSQALVSGSLLIVFGVFFLAFFGIRMLNGESDWIGYVGMGFGLFALPAGIVTIVWAWRVMRLWRKEMKELDTAEG